MSTTKTIAKDIEATLTAERTEKIALNSHLQTQHLIVTYTAASTAEEKHFMHRINANTIANQNRDAAAAALKKVPPLRRSLAKEVITYASALALEASHLGDYYSGDTDYLVKWGAAPDASTIVSTGHQYSNSCKYKKNDATHKVTITALGAVHLYQNKNLVASSLLDHLPLISLMPDGSAVWVIKKNKCIKAVHGWIAYQDHSCYHSTVSMAHAIKGLAKKLAAIQKIKDERQASRRAERRLRLITRHCTSVCATIADAIALGFCTPGIRAFQDFYSIGDTASLKTLVETGNDSAIRLALHLARKVGKKQTATA